MRGPDITSTDENVNEAGCQRPRITGGNEPTNEPVQIGPKRPFVRDFITPGDIRATTSSIQEDR
jgi:hypothetical protein